MGSLGGLLHLDVKKKEMSHVEKFTSACGIKQFSLLLLDHACDQPESQSDLRFYLGRGPTHARDGKFG